jgi:hypothetical protein
MNIKIKAIAGTVVLTQIKVAVYLLLNKWQSINYQIIAKEIQMLSFCYQTFFHLCSFKLCLFLLIELPAAKKNNRHIIIKPKLPL